MSQSNYNRSQDYKSHGDSNNYINRTPRARPPRPNPPEDPYLADAKKFMNLYYDTLDNKRDKIVHLYGATCRLLFDGNPFNGGDTINEFWQNRFPTSVHTIRAQDYKNHGDTLLILMTSGEVLLDSKRRTFSQVLVCQRQDGMWKIMSDEYRLLN
uniref:NTF2 domain-containing protein n=1 Tax=Panagrolaimus sp. ES5 TaxID=591445 RepID=A0AC34F3C6_9BILA